MRSVPDECRYTGAAQEKNVSFQMDIFASVSIIHQKCCLSHEQERPSLKMSLLSCRLISSSLYQLSAPISDSCGSFHRWHVLYFFAGLSSIIFNGFFSPLFMLSLAVLYFYNRRKNNFGSEQKVQS